MSAAGFDWDLEYDAARFIPLPRPTGATLDADIAERWVEECVQRLAPVPVAQGSAGASAPRVRPIDPALLRVTAESLVAQAGPEAARLWFVPPGLYSDVLVAVSVSRRADEVPGAFEAMFDGASFSTMPALVPVLSEKRGKGFLVRRTAAFDDPGAPERPVLVAQWTLRLDDGDWVVLVDALGTTLPVFAAFEDEILRLAEGIETPAPGPAVAGVEAGTA